MNEWNLHNLPTPHNVSRSRSLDVLRHVLRGGTIEHGGAIYDGRSRRFFISLFTSRRRHGRRTFYPAASDELLLQPPHKFFGCDGVEASVEQGLIGRNRGSLVWNMTMKYGDTEACDACVRVYICAD